MDFQVWNVILFSLKWVWVGLVYLALSIVLLAVRREFSVQAAAKSEEAPYTAGHLKVLDAGKGTPWRSGDRIRLLPLTTLGSERDNEIVLQDAFISRHHARLRWDGAVWSIEDLGSQNGTWVNQVRCEPYQAVTVPAGATVKLGEMSFELIE